MNPAIAPFGAIRARAHIDRFHGVESLLQTMSYLPNCLYIYSERGSRLPSSSLTDSKWELLEDVKALLCPLYSSFANIQPEE